MCLIIARTNDNPNGYITDEDLASAVDRNHDGIGVMYPHEGKLVVEYLLGTQEEIIAFYRKHERIATKAFAAHLRLTTDGKNCVANCHPHKIIDREDGDRKTVYMMHNGIISKHRTSMQAETSDTVEFVKAIVTPWCKKYPNVYKTPEFQTVVGEYIGYSKLIFMDERGRISFVNKDQGIERNGMWLSNSYSVTNDSKTKTGAVTRTINGKQCTWDSTTTSWVPIYQPPVVNRTTSPASSQPTLMQQQYKKTQGDKDLFFLGKKLSSTNKVINEYYNYNDDFYLYYYPDAKKPFWVSPHEAWVGSEIDHDSAEEHYETLVLQTLQEGDATEVYEMCDKDIETVVATVKKHISRTVSSKYLRRHIKKGLGYYKTDNYLIEFFDKLGV